MATCHKVCCMCDTKQKHRIMTRRMFATRAGPKLVLEQNAGRPGRRAFTSRHHLLPKLNPCLKLWIISHCKQGMHCCLNSDGILTSHAYAIPCCTILTLQLMLCLLTEHCRASRAQDPVSTNLLGGKLHGVKPADPLL